MNKLKEFNELHCSEDLLFLGNAWDGGSAISAQLNDPEGIAVDSLGNLYIADYINRCIRMVGKAYMVTFNSNDGSAVSSQPVNYNGTGTETLPADPTRTGYNFGGWYSDSGLTTSFDIATVITGDTTLYAKWAISDFASSGQTTTTATFTWTAASGATSLKIQQSPTGANTWTDSSVDTGYDFKLVVVGGKNAGDSNTAVNVVTNTVPVAPTSVSAVAGTAQAIVSFTPPASNGGSAIMVRGLGLKLENGSSSFTDVKTTDWYSVAIQTANAYSLISGFEDGTFRPMDKITREQAMTIIASAMKVTGLEASLGAKAADRINSFHTCGVLCVAT